MLVLVSPKERDTAAHARTGIWATGFDSPLWLLEPEVTMGNKGIKSMCPKCGSDDVLVGSTVLKCMTCGWSKLGATPCGTCGAPSVGCVGGNGRDGHYCERHEP